MAILAIDHGAKRIGLAISDALGIAAHGLPTLRRTTLERDLQAIRQIVEDRAVSEIVVGLPRNMDGSLGPQASLAQSFADEVEAATGLPVRLVDERLSSRRAERTLAQAGLTARKRKARVDRMAAQFILEQYLSLRRMGHAPPEPDS